MKRMRGTLEYHRINPSAKRRARWGFSFKTVDGDLLIKSGKTFASRAQAEKGFVTFIKSIATNTYAVAVPSHSRN